MGHTDGGQLGKKTLEAFAASTFLLSGIERAGDDNRVSKIELTEGFGESKPILVLLLAPMDPPPR